TRSTRDWSSDVCSSDLSEGCEPPSASLPRDEVTVGREEHGLRSAEGSGAASTPSRRTDEQSLMASKESVPGTSGSRRRRAFAKRSEERRVGKGGAARGG